MKDARSEKIAESVFHNTLRLRKWRQYSLPVTEGLDRNTNCLAKLRLPEMHGS
jgi:hypothetical protein